MVKRIHGGALGKIIVASRTISQATSIGRLGRTLLPSSGAFAIGCMTASFPATSSWNRTFTSSTLQLVLKAHPLKASASGGRAGRPADGDVYGNYNVLFPLSDGVDVTFSSTQFSKGWWEVTERFFGTKGTSQSPYTGPLGIWGDEPWQAEGTPAKDAEQTAFSATGKFTSNLELRTGEEESVCGEHCEWEFSQSGGQGRGIRLSCNMESRS